MGFIINEDSYISKGDVPTEGSENDQEMLEVAPIIGSSIAVVGSSSSMEENIANMCRRMKEMHTLQVSRHEEVCNLLRNLDIIVSHLEKKFYSYFGDENDDMSVKF